MRPRATVQVEKSGTPATGQTNPTNYESGDTTNSAVAVTVSEYSQSFNISSQEGMQGHRLETKAANNLHNLLDDIWDVPAALLDETVFTNTVVVALEAAIDADDLATGWGSIAKSRQKHCVLSGPAYARFNAQNREAFNHEAGAYNFDTFSVNTSWGAAQDANTRGFFCGPNAIAIASGLPVIDQVVQNQMEASTIITLPDAGLSVQLCLWGSVGTRTLWASYGIMFGAAVGDATALTLYQTS
jgi:hypothetical protein